MPQLYKANLTPGLNEFNDTIALNVGRIQRALPWPGGGSFLNYDGFVWEPENRNIYVEESVATIDSLRESYVGVVRFPVNVYSWGDNILNGQEEVISTDAILYCMPSEIDPVNKTKIIYNWFKAPEPLFIVVNLSLDDFIELANTSVPSGTGMTSFNISDGTNTRSVQDLQTITIEQIGDVLSVLVGDVRKITFTLRENLESFKNLSGGSSITLANAPIKTPLVFRNGVYQLCGSIGAGDPCEISGNEITFAQAFGPGGGFSFNEEIVVQYFY